MRRCTSLLGWILGHKFVPRYNYGDANLAHLRVGPQQDMVPVIEAFKPRTYIKDVCERCGQIANNNAGDQT